MAKLETALEEFNNVAVELDIPSSLVAVVRYENADGGHTAGMRSTCSGHTDDKDRDEVTPLLALINGIIDNSEFANYMLSAATHYDEVRMKLANKEIENVGQH